MDTIQVQVTKDYGLFKTIDGNRDVNELHVKRLTTSMQEKHLISPIIVNEKYQIIDGQHRFRAARELKFPVYYIVIPGYGLSDVQRLNQNSKNWTSTDFLDGYCDLGIPDYVQFKHFCEQYDFTMTITLAIVLDKVPGGGYWDDFKNGKFKFDDYFGATERADKITALKSYTELYNTRTFVAAMITLLKNPKFELTTFMQKLSYQQGALVPCTTANAYITLIEEIYNYKNRNKVSLRY